MNKIIQFTINGELIQWRFNNYAYKLFVLKAMGKNYILVAPYAMFYAGLCANAYVKDLPEPSFEQSCEWADLLASEQPDVIAQIDSAFTESTQYKKLMGIDDAPLDSEQTEDEKKNTSTIV